MDDSTPTDHCPFCAAQMAADAARCPECGRSADEGPAFSPHRPVWTKPVAIAFLVLLAIALVAWVLNLVKLF